MLETKFVPVHMYTHFPAVASRYITGVTVIVEGWSGRAHTLHEISDPSLTALYSVAVLTTEHTTPIAKKMSENEAYVKILPRARASERAAEYGC